MRILLVVITNKNRIMLSYTIGFFLSKSNISLFIKEKHSFIALFVYVDDLILGRDVKKIRTCGYL